MIVELLICVLAVVSVSFLCGYILSERTQLNEECQKRENTRKEDDRRRSVANLAKLICDMQALCAKEAIDDKDWAGVVGKIPDWISLALVEKYTFLSSQWADIPGNDAQAERQAKLRRVIRVQIKVAETAMDKLIREAAL